MAKSSEHVGLKKIHEVTDGGDLLCTLNKTTVLTRKSADDGGYAYGRLGIVKGSHWQATNIPGDVLIEKCKLIGSEQIVAAVSASELSVYSISGHHVRTLQIQKKGRVKTVENITAIAIIADKILVAESKRYNTLIHVVDYLSGDTNMSLSIDEKVVGIIPVRPGLILVRLKEKIQAVDFLSYPRVDVTEVIAYGRTLVSTFVKGPNDELYVMFVKGVRPKVLELYVLDENFEEVHHTNIAHSTSILSLRAVFTSPGSGYLVVQMGNTVITYKCFDGNRKGTGKTRDGKSAGRKKYYSERLVFPPPTPVPSPAKSQPEDTQQTKENDDGGSLETTPRKVSLDSNSNYMAIGPVLCDSKEATSKPSSTSEKQEGEGNAEEKKNKGDPTDIRRARSAPPKAEIPDEKEKSEHTKGYLKNDLNAEIRDEKSANDGEYLSEAVRSKMKLDIDNTQSFLTAGQDHDYENLGETTNSTAFESGYIGEDGGVIKSVKYGFSLRIPPGAIPKGQRKKIGVGLSRESHGALSDGAGVSISPCVYCAPSGLELEKPAKISLQHCLSSWSTDTLVNVHEDVGDVKTSDASTDEVQRGQGTARCLIGKDELELEVNRLGRYSLKVMGSEIYKKLACRPFIPKCMPATRKPIINVLIYDHTEGMKKMMLEDMQSESPYPVTPAHIGKNFIFNLSAEDSPEITLTCHSGGSKEEKSLPASDLIEFSSNSIDFQVNCCDQQPKDVTIQLKFGHKTVDMICHVDIPRIAHTLSPLVSRANSQERICQRSRKRSSSADANYLTDVPSQILHEIAGEVPHNYYLPLGLKFGLEKAKLDSFLISCGNDYEEATYRAIEAWKNRQGLDNRESLRNILIEADLRRIAERFLS